MQSSELHTPRARAPPPPIRVLNNSFKAGSSNQLLYDLPSSPPLSATSPPPGGPISPRSPPTSPTVRSRIHASRIKGTPPPSHTRSSSPQVHMQQQQDQFAAYCREWYFNNDANAGDRMTKFLASLPPSQKAEFVRLQASIRASYHASEAARRLAEFEAHLSATHPGGSLTPPARASPDGKVARMERRVKLERFILNWCTSSMPGTVPFFQSLWAILRLQSLPESLGGAGCWRIEWELDDAVFMESGGKDFMLEAIDVLKGVLGFEEAKSLRRSQSFRMSKDLDISLTLRGPRPSPETFDEIHSSRQPPPSNTISSNTATKRSRAPSDPFIDTPQSPRSIIASQKTLAAAQASTASAGQSSEELLAPLVAQSDSQRTAPISENKLDTNTQESFVRIWTAPSIPNPELITLIALFPSFVSVRTLPRFSSPGRSRPADLEQGEDLSQGRGEVRYGTGHLRLGPLRRSDGWQGSLWEQLLTWFKQILCL